MATSCFDDFNFNEEVLGNAGFSTTTNNNSHNPMNCASSLENEVQTSFLLTNALLNILLRKGIISQNEVQELVAELFEVYQQKKGLI